MTSQKKIPRAIISLSIVFISVLFTYLVLAQHIVTPLSFTVNQSQNFFYNITINNNDISSINNVTRINITLPAGFTFVVGSNGSYCTVPTGCAPASFTFNSTFNLLSWFNDTAGLANGTWNRYVWFNATANSTVNASAATYIMTVVTMANSTATTTNTTNIAVGVNDIRAPSFSFISPTPSNVANLSYSNLTINVSVADNVALKTIGIYVYNMTGASAVLLNNTNTTLSGTTNFTNLTIFNLPDGVYSVNISLNDTAGNVNATSMGANGIMIKVDTVYPNSSWALSGNAADYLNTTQTSIFANVSNVSDANLVNITFTLANSTGVVNITTFTTNSSDNHTITWSGLPDEHYSYNVTVSDAAGNINTTSTLHTTIDTHAPAVSLSKSSSDTTSLTLNIGISEAMTGISSCSVNRDNAVISGSNTSQTVTEDNLACDSGYQYSVTCTDYAGNHGSDTETFATAGCGSSGGSSGGSSSSDTTSWTATYAYADTELSVQGPVTRDLTQNQRESVKVNNVVHYVGVTSVSSTQATIVVMSTPQQATLNVGQSQEFDLNGDGYYDVKVTLNSITGSKANVSTVYVHDLVSASANSAGNETTNTAGNAASDNGASAGNVQTNTSSKMIYWIIGIVVLVIIIVVVAMGMGKSRKINGRVKVKHP